MADKRKINENSKEQQLDPYRMERDEQYLTTNQGLRISHTDDSLKAGERGPTLMEDFHFREKLTHFDHESIPERVVHARGAGAHGFFQVHESMEEYTMAKFLCDTSVKTPVFVRFSTVVGPRGSADTVRDVRGFATKFYTQEGNFDLVGNNMPVFFIQDGIKFPDLVHAIKSPPDSEMPTASAAHDTFWDFASLMPESAHMLMWVLSDRAIPRSFRMMQGFGVHTFRLVNAQGKARFVKFHWRPVLGTHSLVWDEAQKLAGKDPDWLRRDLWEAIEMGNYPEFEFGVQIVEEEDEFAFDFDLLDPTKIIPEELVPVRTIGKMTLTRNTDDFFSETEQVAFHPGNVVPGIDFTNDPLLQGRLFSYLDTQLTRLGGPNFHEIPINRPVVPVSNNQGAGFSRQTIGKGKVNYFPNSLANGCPMMAPQNMGGYVHYAEKVEGTKIRERSESFKDFFSQATLFWNSMTPVEKQHIIEAAHFELGKVETMAVRERMVHEIFNNVDHDFAVEVAKGIGVKPPSEPGTRLQEALQKVKGAVARGNGKGKRSVDASLALSMERMAKGSLETRRVAILAAEGVDTAQVEQLKQALNDAGAGAKVVSMFLGTVSGAKGGDLQVDKSYVVTGSIMFDAVLIPDGSGSVEELKTHGAARHFIQEAFKHGKPIAALGAGIELLRESDIKGVQLSDSGETVSDQGVVTVGSPSDLGSFVEQFSQAITQHRHWTRGAKDMVPA
jgi:catalase